MKERIMRLRRQGWSYTQIIEEIGCSLSTVSYYCGEKQKEKRAKRDQKWRSKNPIHRKIEKFKCRTIKSKALNFHRTNIGGRTKCEGKATYTIKEVYDKIMADPICYLTGRKLDLSDTKLFHLDHKIPTSRGGDCSLENMGTTCPEANQAKTNLTIEELLNLCQEILSYWGYEVKKIGAM